MICDADFVEADTWNLPKVEHVDIVAYIASTKQHGLAEIRETKTLMSSRDGHLLEDAVGFVQVQRAAGRCTVKAKLVLEHRPHCEYLTVSCVVDEANEIIIDAACLHCDEGSCAHSLLLPFWLAMKSAEPRPATACFWTEPLLAQTSAVYITAEELAGVEETERPPKDPRVLQEFLEECKRRNIQSLLTSHFNDDDDEDDDDG